MTRVFGIEHDWFYRKMEMVGIYRYDCEESMGIALCTPIAVYALRVM